MNNINNQNPKNQPLAIVTLDLGENVPSQIRIYPGDDITILASIFCQRN